MASAALVPASFESLPHALQLAVFALLPVDQRMRCAEVRRSWHATLADSSLWTRLDLSGASAVVARVTDELLRAASERAGGQLESLDATGCDNITLAALLAVVTANAAALRELRVATSAPPLYEALLRAAPQLRVFGSAYCFSAEHVEALLVAAPRLDAFYTEVYSASRADTRRMLRNEPPFGPLRAGFLTAANGGEAEVIALAADMAGHTSLTGCSIHDAQLDTPAAVDALMGAVLTLRMTSLELHECFLSPAAAPALARVLAGGWVTKLHVVSSEQMLDAPAATLLSNALRLNSTLTDLALVDLDMWREPAAGTALLGALIGHPSLRQLTLWRNRVAPEHQAAAGRSLGTLVAVNSAALQSLRIGHCDLGDAGLGPLVDALASNTHLRTLECAVNDITVAFARTKLMPMLITNSSLRQLRLVRPAEEHNVHIENEDDDERKESLATLRMIEDAVAARAAVPAGN
jgi:hypothetical protein